MHVCNFYTTSGPCMLTYVHGFITYVHTCAHTSSHLHGTLIYSPLGDRTSTLTFAHQLPMHIWAQIGGLEGYIDVHV